jgi:hypothetical protein
MGFTVKLGIEFKDAFENAITNQKKNNAYLLQ